MVRDESREDVENDGECGGQLEGPSHGEDRPLEDSRRPQRFLEETVKPRHLAPRVSHSFGFRRSAVTQSVRSWASTFRWRYFNSLVTSSYLWPHWVSGPSVCKCNIQPRTNGSWEFLPLGTFWAKIHSPEKKYFLRDGKRVVICNTETVLGGNIIWSTSLYLGSTYCLTWEIFCLTLAWSRIQSYRTFMLSYIPHVQLRWNARTKEFIERRCGQRIQNLARQKTGKETERTSTIPTS